MSPPSIDDVRDGLRSALGDGYDDMWVAVCTKAGVGTEVANIDDDDFDRLLSAIVAHGILCRVLAMSWIIRKATARKLTELGR